VPRIRSVLPGQWTDDRFVSCTPLARLLAIALRNEADDNGVFEFNPIKIKMRLLPMDECDINDLLGQLVDTAHIMVHEQSGKNFGIIRNFSKFQKPKRPSVTFPIMMGDLPDGYEPTYGPDGKRLELSGEHGRDNGEHGRDNKPDCDPVVVDVGVEVVVGVDVGEEEEKALVDPAGSPGGEDEEIDITLPVKSGDPFCVTEEVVSKWAKHHPELKAEGVRSAFRSMGSWLEGSPSRRKTGQGMGRFVSSWLNRAKADSLKSPKKKDPTAGQEYDPNFNYLD